jgi:hypothetical protein
VSNIPTRPDEPPRRILDHCAAVLGPVRALHLQPDPQDVGVWVMSAPNPELPGMHCVMTTGISSLSGLVYADALMPAPRVEYARIVESAHAEDPSVGRHLWSLGASAFEDGRVFDPWLVVDRSSTDSDSSLTHALMVAGSPLPAELGRLAVDAFAVVWVLPITSPEAAYARNHGAARLMLLLRWSAGDELFALNRDSIAIPTAATLADTDLEASDDLPLTLFELLEGEPDRQALLALLAGFLGSDDTLLEELACEVVEALMLSEPSSFGRSALEDIERRLQDVHDENRDPAADTTRAVRHALHAHVGS